METIGKILSLTLLAIFGTAGTIIYFTDSGPSTPVVRQSVTKYQHPQAESRRDVDYAAYRGQLRRSYIESETSQEMNSQPREEGALWKNTYDSLSEEVKRLSKEISYSQLKENVQFWNNQYHQALRVGNKEAANEAYTKYRNYKEALEMKGTLQ